MAAPDDSAEHVDAPSATVADASSWRESIVMRTALRLPSFEALGIANPRPDSPRIGQHKSGNACSASVPPSHSLPMSITHSGLTQLTLTPPTEAHDLLWSSTETLRQHASVLAATRDMTDAEKPTSNDDGILTPHLTPRADSVVPDTAEQPDYDRHWLDNALQAIFTRTSALNQPNHTMKVLSHALPCPSPDGHVFTHVMTSLYRSPSLKSTTWINVFHALPGRFNLGNLPTSPPATPGQPFQGEDYFTQKVFDSAVPIADYQTDLSMLPRSPRPAVPPGTIDLAIVERYIPPTSTMEFASMFDANAPSILVDRLVELAPDNGSLLFIYPTRAGAQTFAQSYLSPILDPLLRSLAMVHSLPMAFCNAVGRVPVVSTMLSHEQMTSRLKRLCEQLSSPTHRANSTLSRYDLAYASTAQVSPARKVWSSEWWLKQEKDRIRREIVTWSQQAQDRRISELSGVERSTTPAELLQKLLDGIAMRPYPSGQAPINGLEVNVFVITKSYTTDRTPLQC